MNKAKKNSINFVFKTLALLAFSLLVIPASASAEGVINYIYDDYSYSIKVNDSVGSYNSTSVNNQDSNPKPIINSISPDSANRNTSAKTITITGSGFIPSSVARVNNVNRTTTFIDPTHLFIQLGSSDMYNKDGFYITVWNQAPGGGYSNAKYFTLKNVVVTGNTNSNNNNSANTGNNNDSYSNTNYTNTEDTTDSYSNLASNVIYGSDSFLPSGLVQWVFIGIIILLLLILARKMFGAEDHYMATPLKHE